MFYFCVTKHRLCRQTKCLQTYNHVAPITSWDSGNSPTQGTSVKYYAMNTLQSRHNFPACLIILSVSSQTQNTQNVFWSLTATCKRELNLIWPLLVKMNLRQKTEK